MSLGSKELFHSNFLEYLCGVNQHAFIMMLNSFLPDNPLPNRNDYIIGREKKNFDICIYHKEGNKNYYDLVLENKVKSIPYKEQLKDYVEKAKNSKSNNCRFILLTLSEDFPDKGDKDIEKWKIVQYEELKEQIDEQYLKTNICSDKQSLYIKDYCGFIDDLVRLKQNIILPSDIEQHPLFDQTTIDSLKAIRLHDLYIKLRCSWFVMTLKKKLIEERLLSPVIVVHKYDEIYKNKVLGIYLNVDINQGNGQIAAWIYDSNDKNGNTFEVVIQGNQYRHGINQKSVTTPDAEKKYGSENWKFGRLNLLYERLQNPNYVRAKNFMDFGGEADVKPGKGDNFRKTKGKKIPKAGPFCCYDDSYIYRHKSIDNKNVNELMDNMVKDISEIFPNMPNLK